MLPLLIATCPGAEERRSIVVLVVGGQTFSRLLLLLAISVLYSFFDDLSAIALQTLGFRAEYLPVAGSLVAPAWFMVSK